MDKNEEKKNQYHPPFCAAMELELRKDRKRIDFRKEHNLNTMPNRIDLLVVKRNKRLKLKSGLGAIFRKYNLIEYKSPRASLNRITYYRTMGYAYLLAAYGKRISLEEITISFVREGKPKKMMEQFRRKNFEITEYQPGIYHLKKKGHVDMQVIVLRELGSQYKWVTKLTKQVKRADMEDMEKEIRALKDEQDLQNAIAVLDLMTKVNISKKWMKEVKGMGAFRDLFKEEFESKDSKIKELNGQLKSQEEQLKSQSEQLQNQNEQLQSKEEQLQSQEEQLKSKEEQLQSQEEQLKSQSEQLQNQEEQLRSKEEQLQSQREENARLRKLLNMTAMF